jgi:hypothetical protein
MASKEHSERARDLAELRFRPPVDGGRDPETRTIVIRQSATGLSIALLFLCLLVIGVVLLGHEALRGLERRNQETSASIASLGRKIGEVESGLSFESKRRRLLLAMRDHILKVNPRASVGEAYLYAQLAVEAGEKYPSVDPLLLLAIGTVESGYDPQATSRADARGLYQIWPSTGRLLFRALGWDYEDASLFDPTKNTEAAALYLDILFSAYSDHQLVLAEYNGGPLNAGYLRAGRGPLAGETRDYVPRVLQLYARLQEALASAGETDAVAARDPQRRGKTLGGTGAATLRR